MQENVKCWEITEHAEKKELSGVKSSTHSSGSGCTRLHPSWNRNAACMQQFWTVLDSSVWTVGFVGFLCPLHASQPANSLGHNQGWRGCNRHRNRTKKGQFAIEQLSNWSYCPYLATTERFPSKYHLCTSRSILFIDFLGLYKHFSVVWACGRLWWTRLYSSSSCFLVKVSTPAHPKQQVLLWDAMSGQPLQMTMVAGSGSDKYRGAGIC